MEDSDIEKRWPELFEGLNDRQRSAVFRPLVAGWHEGNFPSREVVKTLTDLARGDIDFDRYRQRAIGPKPGLDLTVSVKKNKR